MAILPGSRIRDNGVFGTITDNPLTVGATTFNSADLNRLSVVSGNHALVTLDPLREFGESEIVMVTAHTAASTVATIQRGMFGTTARSHPQNTLWVHAACDNDFIEVLTSSTRPSDQYEGQFIYETDTNKLVGFGGVDWAPRDAGGQLGYAQAVVNQTGITAETSLTNLSTSVTVGTGRRVKLSGFLGLSRTVADGLTRLRIKEGAISIVFADFFVQAGSAGAVGCNLSAIITPSPGVHTYNITMQQVTGTGTSGTGGADIGCTPYILIEDIGAA